MHTQSTGFRTPIPKLGADRRRHKRVDVACNVRLAAGPGELICDAAIVDVSEGGARLRVSFVPTDMVPQRFFLLLSKIGTARRACEVVWRKETELGVRFVTARDAMMSS